MTEDSGNDGGNDNPAFSHDEDQTSEITTTTSTMVTSHPVNGGTTITIIENGKNHSSTFQPAEVINNTETKIDVPEDTLIINGDKVTPKTKQNGVHSNGNNNDVSFLNTTVTSITNNGTLFFRKYSNDDY